MKLSGVRLASLLLRLGLVIVFVYAAVGSIVSPNDWVGYLPRQSAVSPYTLLKIFSVYELVLVAWLIWGKHVRWVALLSAATMAGIVLADPHLLAITFRDIAIACAALALAALE
jgi:hypothetical protein